MVACHATQVALGPAAEQEYHSACGGVCESDLSD